MGITAVTNFLCFRYIFLDLTLSSLYSFIALYVVLWNKVHVH